jgi:hypothetical protein
MPSHQEQAGLFCLRCQQHRLFVRTVTSPNHIAHLLASVFLCGLWLPVWFLIAALGDKTSEWCCTQCGSRPAKKEPMPKVARVPNYPGSN